jgi:hypothetical protein
VTITHGDAMGFRVIAPLVRGSVRIDFTKSPLLLESCASYRMIPIMISRITALFFGLWIFSVVVVRAEELLEKSDKSLAAAEATRIEELNQYWGLVSRAVKEGDFAAYQATCHSEGVLVSGTKNYSQPLAKALARWQQEFIDTRAGKIKASVEFRFTRRLGDATTALESGIFCYTSQAPSAEPKVEYVNFESLLVKRPDGWKTLMENQQSATTEAEWQRAKK